MLALAPTDTCPWCGKPLRSDNGTGVCYLCQRLGRGPRMCATGCGQRLSRKNKSGFCAACFIRRIIVLATTKG